MSCNFRKAKISTYPGLPVFHPNPPQNKVFSSSLPPQDWKNCSPLKKTETPPLALTHGHLCPGRWGGGFGGGGILRRKIQYTVCMDDTILCMHIRWEGCGDEGRKEPFIFFPILLIILQERKLRKFQIGKDFSGPLQQQFNFEQIQQTKGLKNETTPKQNQQHSLQISAAFFKSEKSTR